MDADQAVLSTLRDPCPGGTTAICCQCATNVRFASSPCESCVDMSRLSGLRPRQLPELSDTERVCAAVAKLGPSEIVRLSDIESSVNIGGKRHRKLNDSLKAIMKAYIVGTETPAFYLSPAGAVVRAGASNVGWLDAAKREHLASRHRLGSGADTEYSDSEEEEDVPCAFKGCSNPLRQNRARCMLNLGTDEREARRV